MPCCNCNLLGDKEMSEDECGCTETELCVYHDKLRPDHPDRRNVNLKQIEALKNNAMKLLGITEDQLKIARALDREKIESLRNHFRGYNEWIQSMGASGTSMGDWLPTFDEEKSK